MEVYVSTSFWDTQDYVFDYVLGDSTTQSTVQLHENKFHNKINFGTKQLLKESNKIIKTICPCISQYSYCCTMQGNPQAQFVQGIAGNLRYLCEFIEKTLEAVASIKQEQAIESEETKVNCDSNDEATNISTQMSEHKKPKNIKKKESSNKPKKPISSFVFYFQEQLKKRDHPSNQKEVGKLAQILSKEWKSLPSSLKQPYYIKAEESKETYKEGMKSFNVEHADQIKEIKKLKRMASNKLRRLKRRRQSKNHDGAFKEKSPKKKPKQKAKAIYGLEKPKYPLSSFFLYFQENCQRISQAHEENRRSRLVQIASEEWRSLSKNQKEKYEKLTRINKEIYDKKLEEYNEKLMQMKEKHMSPASPLLSEKSDHEKSGETEIKLEARNHIKEKDTSLSKAEDSYEENIDIDESTKKDVDSLGQPSLTQSSSSICNDELSSSGSYVQGETIERPEDFIQFNQDHQKQGLMFANTEIISRRNKRSRRNKSTILPKGPVSSFFLYYNCTVKELKKDFPNMRGSDLVRIASEKWNQFAEEEKQIYQQEAKRGRQLYEIQMQKFEKEYPEEAAKLKYFKGKKNK